ncbi:MAG: hypothetical protein KAT62_02880 [Desulfuromonadales bacterium]|nr:hypothetical protein [Desulfuromonadales bacterium]
MQPEDQILFAGKLLELVREMEQVIIDHCRLLTANNDGCLLEKEEIDQDPF